MYNAKIFRQAAVAAMTCLAAHTAAPPSHATPIAEIICAPSAEMTHKLSRVFGNSLHAWGMQEPEQVMQVWTSDNGSWTLVVRYATGLSCIVAMGENWETRDAEKPA